MDVVAAVVTTVIRAVVVPAQAVLLRRQHHTEARIASTVARRECSQGGCVWCTNHLDDDCHA